jgi:hypothetical protein
MTVKQGEYFSLTKSDMLKQTATLSPETKSVKVKKKQMKCLQAALAGEGGAQGPDPRTQGEL